MPKTKLTKQEYDSFRNKWIKDTVYFMDRDQLENYTMLYFQEDLKTEDQEDIIEWYVTETNKKEAKRPRKTNKQEDKK